MVRLERLDELSWNFRSILWEIEQLTPPDVDFEELEELLQHLFALEIISERVANKIKQLSDFVLETYLSFTLTQVEVNDQLKRSIRILHHLQTIGTESQAPEPHLVSSKAGHKVNLSHNRPVLRLVSSR